jgi:putative endonuclease
MGIFVYMLRCSDGSYYVGSATGDDLGPRIDQHNAGSHEGYTFSRRPVVLVWSEHFDRITDGIAVERKLKGWSRAKKEALIDSDWTKISRLGTAARRCSQDRMNRILRGSPKRLAPQDDDTSSYAAGPISTSSPARPKKPRRYGQAAAA